jgi:hypothetical protein
MVSGRCLDARVRACECELSPLGSPSTSRMVYESASKSERNVASLRPGVQLRLLAEAAIIKIT